MDGHCGRGGRCVRRSSHHAERQGDGYDHREGRCQCGKTAVETRYTLKADSQYLEVATTYKNETPAAVKVALTDDLRCDGGKEDMLKTPNGTAVRFTIEDRFWHQAYGFEASGWQLLTNSDARRTEIKYVDNTNSHEVEIGPGESFTLTRHLSAAPTLPEVTARLSSQAAAKVTLAVQSTSGQRITVPRVEIRQGDTIVGTIIGNERGELITALPAGAYSLKVSHNGAKVADALPLTVESALVEQSQAVRLAGTSRVPSWPESLMRKVDRSPAR